MTLKPVRTKRDLPTKRATKKAATSKQPRFTQVTPESFYFSTLNWLVSSCEKEPPYQANNMERDEWLSKIWQLEPHLAGTIHSVVSIDTNRGWSLEGGRNQVLRYSDILHSWQAAPGLAGWRPGIAGASLSFYTTDLGAIIELGRDEQGGPLRGLFNTDPTRCYLNSSMEAPLTYLPNMATRDSASAQDWLVEDFIRISSMASILEKMNGLGFCAVSRCIELAKLMVAIYEHDKEQLGAKAPRGLLLLNGITEPQWDAAMEARDAKLEGEGYDYFNAVAVIAGSGLDEVKAELVALSQMPQGFDLQQFTSLLMYGYALCFGYDPSEFYPVQFGALGRGTEMEVQHEKATGKGGLNFILTFQEQLQRSDVLPPSLSYEFDQRDEQAEIEQANVQDAWATTYRNIREAGLDVDQQGGISREEFRTLLADHEIIPREWTEVEVNTEVTDEEPTGTEVEQPMPTGSQPTKDILVPIFQPLLQARQKRIMRDNLLSQRHIWEAISRFPNEDIVKYRWPANRMITLWEDSKTLLDRMLYPTAVSQAVSRAALYKSKELAITDEDIVLALEEAGTIDPELQQLLDAKEVSGVDVG